MAFTAPGECEDRDHVIVGDKIQFNVSVVEGLRGERVTLIVKKIEIDEQGNKVIWVGRE